MAKKREKKTPPAKKKVVIYAATLIEKEVEEDHYENGLIGGRTCLMSDQINITAPSLAELFAKLGDAYGLDIDDLFIPGEDDEPINWVGYNRMEDVDCNEPDEAELQGFRDGSMRLWQADYSFFVEKRVVLPITLDELKATGLKTH